MATLARIRAAAIPRRLVSPSRTAHITLSLTRSQPLQAWARSVQTAADTTQLQEGASHSEPFMVRLHEDSFKGYRTDTPSLDVEVTKESLLTWYKQMAVIRRMEQAADALYKQKLIRGFCHLAIGQVCLASLLRTLRACAGTS